MFEYEGVFEITHVHMIENPNMYGFDSEIWLVSGYISRRAAQGS